MTVQTLTMARQKFAVIPYEDYQLLVKGSRPDDTGLPPLPKALPGGNFPAREFMRASIARDIIKGRRKVRLSQAELARRAGIQPAVLNRIERARVDAETATVDKLLAAIKAAKSSRPRVR